MRTRSLAWLLIVLSIGCRQESVPAPMPAASPFDVADRHYHAGRYEDAAAEYSGLREQFAAARRVKEEWRARLWWVKSMHFLGRNKELEGEFDPLFRLSAGDPIREAWTRCTRGIVRARMARYDEALADGHSGLEVARLRRDHRLSSACYDTLITTLSHTGRYRESLRMGEERLAIDRARAAPPFELADALNDIGIDYRHLGRFEDGIAVYEEAFSLYREIENPEGQAKVLFNLGNIYSAIGEKRRDVELKRESLAIAERMGHAWGLGMIHGDLGDSFRQAGSLSEARKHLDAAIRIARDADLPMVEVNALEDLGRTETAEGNFARARMTLATAMELADRKKMPAYRSQLRSAAARNEAAHGRGAEAVRYADEALAIARTLDDPEIEFEALEARALALEAAASPDAAAAFLEGVELLESMRGRLAMGDLRMGVAERRLGVYEGAIRILSVRGEVEQSLEVAERARARVLLAMMAERDAVRASDSAEEVLKQRLRETWEAQRSVRPELRGTWSRQITELTSRLAEIETQERVADPARSALRNPRPASAAEIPAMLLADGSTLLSYFWGDRDVYGWWINPAGSRVARLGTVSALAPLVDYTRLSVEQGSEWRAASSRAFAKLVLPLGPVFSSRIFVIPDGPIANLPLEVLLFENEPWGRSAEFIYGPSASVLLALRKRPPARGFAGTLLAVGDPRADRFPLLASLNPAERADAVALPFAAKEVRWISKILDGKREMLIGSEATTAAWLSRRPEEYRYLHFATHARVDDRQPMKTALQMADGDLQVDQIRKMSLPAELVTLSACETALGPRVRGEGVIGLPHAFLSAGAQGVIVTLWRVADDSSAEFIRDVYTEIRKGRTPSRALQEVRRGWIAAGAPPSQWAPFIIIGGND